MKPESVWRIGSMRRAHELFGLAMAARSVAIRYSSPDTIPDRNAVAELQNAASRAGGVPWLISGLLSSYTEVTISQRAADKTSSHEFIMSDIRLLDYLCRIGGFLPGSDLRWFLGSLQELVNTTLVPVGSEFGGNAPSSMAWSPYQAHGQVAQHVLYLLGSAHLAYGRYDPSLLRSLDVRGSREPYLMWRLRGGAVDMLAALSDDAKGSDRSWPGLTDALGRLGAPPTRAKRLACLFGPLTETAARMLTVRPSAVHLAGDPMPPVEDRAGATLALSDLAAISALLADQGQHGPGNGDAFAHQ